jgi:hypothetical protein
LDTLLKASTMSPNLFLSRSPASWLALAALAVALTGCGGGSSSESATTPTEVSLSAVTPSETMTWATAADGTLTLALRDAAGAPAAGATVRVFSFTMTNPQDGEPMDEALPVGEIASGSADAAGGLALDLRLPARFDEVLVVATLGDQQVSQRVRLNTGTATTLSLASPA